MKRTVTLPLCRVIVAAAAVASAARCLPQVCRRSRYDSNPAICSSSRTTFTWAKRLASPPTRKRRHLSCTAHRESRPITLGHIARGRRTAARVCSSSTRPAKFVREIGQGAYGLSARRSRCASIRRTTSGSSIRCRRR